MSNLSLINKNNKILIVGLGLLGGSYAQGLSDVGFEVGAIDINKDSIEYGIKHFPHPNHHAHKICER